MALTANKRSVMQLFSGAMDMESHQVRIVLAEKCSTLVFHGVVQGVVVAVLALYFLSKAISLLGLSTSK
jgi:hypothetical protein